MVIRTIKKQLCFYACILCLYPVWTHSEETSPSSLVHRVVNEVLVLLGNEAMNPTVKKLKVSALVEPHIDLEEMSRRILSVNWKTSSEDERQLFIKLFKQILLRDYWARISQFAGEKVTFTTTRFDTDTLAAVDTVIERPGNTSVIPVSYGMKMKDGKWFAYDFVVENLSLIQNYQREYGAIIKNSGIEGLLEYMNKDVNHSHSNGRN